jgi:hypothetical protein
MSLTVLSGCSLLPNSVTHREPESTHTMTLQALPGAGCQLVGPELYDAFTTLLAPPVRVEVHGYYDPNFSEAARMYVGVANNKSTLALQLPGRTTEYDAVTTATP